MGKPLLQTINIFQLMKKLQPIHLMANIVLEMGYAADLHRGAFIATGVVLFVFVILICALFSAIKRKGERS